MYIQAIIDLWTMRPYAYALVDVHGNPYKAETPHELYKLLDEAYFRDFSPIVVAEMEWMKGQAWTEFVREFPGVCFYRYDTHGVVHGLRDETYMSDEGPEYTRWVRGIATPEQLGNLQKLSVRFGSGDCLSSPEPLNTSSKVKKKRGKSIESPRIRWA
jgi:hypothetical protein